LGVGVNPLFCFGPFWLENAQVHAVSPPPGQHISTLLCKVHGCSNEGHSPIWCADSKVGGGGKSLELFCLILAGKCTSAHCEPTPRAAHQHPTLHTSMRVQMRATTRVWVHKSEALCSFELMLLFPICQSLSQLSLVIS